jgi:hypothetical protein
LLAAHPHIHLHRVSKTINWNEQFGGFHIKQGKLVAYRDFLFEYIASFPDTQMKKEGHRISIFHKYSILSIGSSRPISLRSIRERHGSRKDSKEAKHDPKAHKPTS